MAELEFLPESSDTPSPFSVAAFAVGALLAVAAIAIALVGWLSDLGADGGATPAAWRIGLVEKSAGGVRHRPTDRSVTPALARVPRCAPLLLAAAVALGSAACLTTGTTADLQTDLDDIQQQLWKVQKDTTALNDKLDALGAAPDDPRPVDPAYPMEMGGNEERLVAIQNELHIMGQRIDEMAFRMDTIVQELRASRSGSGAGNPEQHPETGGVDPPAVAAAPPGAGMVSPEELYQNAYADYSRGNYLLAVLGFQEYVRRFPDSELADNAQYWVGESYFSSGDFDSAISAFDQMLARYPNGDRLPSAYLKKGLSYLEENRTPQGVLELQFLVRNYPQSDEARLARDHLQRLGLSVQ